MTETERWVNDTCERIVAGGAIWLYKDLYKDLRQTLPCAEACRLIAEGLDRTCLRPVLAGMAMPWGPFGERRAAFAVLKRLERYAGLAEHGHVLTRDGVRYKGMR